MDDMGSGSASNRTISHMTTHMSGSSIGRIEIVSGRRRWTAGQKLAMLADTFGLGESVGADCERHRIGSGQLQSLFQCSYGTAPCLNHLQRIY